LPKPILDLLRNQYRYFKGLGGPAGLDKVPAHLKTSDSGATANEEPEAGSGEGEDNE